MEIRNASDRKPRTTKGINMPRQDPIDHEGEKITRAEVNMLTRLLCQALMEIQAAGLKIASQELSDWLEEHKKIDRARILKEFIKEKKTLIGFIEEQIQEFKKQLEEME